MISILQVIACYKGKQQIRDLALVNPMAVLGLISPVSFIWASLVAQMVKNLAAMQETRVHSLSGADPLEEGMATDSSTLAWES